MKKEGPDFYDDPAVFERYTAHRSNAQAPNENIEQPLLWGLIGNAQGKAVLDLGCGDARVAKKFREAGAKSYLGIEGSKRMAGLAIENLEGGFSDVQQCWLQDFSPSPNRFDLAVSSLAFHYIEDLKSIFQKIHASLKPDGQLIFSVEHPVLTSCNESLDMSPIRGAWIVDNYSVRGHRQVNWMGNSVSKYHRTLEDYFTLLPETGFRLECLKEAEPLQQHFCDVELWKRRLRIPLFLLIAARKLN